jgi:hypothetical protein
MTIRTDMDAAIKASGAGRDELLLRMGRRRGRVHGLGAGTQMIKTLIICPDFRAAEALAFFYRLTPTVTVKGPSVMGLRAETVVVMPVPDDASAMERESWARMTRESFACRIVPGGKLVVL